jgi:hypothetical protein
MRQPTTDNEPDNTTRQSWVITRGYGQSQRYWGYQKKNGKLTQKLAWVADADRARTYSRPQNAKSALTHLRKYGDMLPEWRVRIEPYNKER